MRLERTMGVALAAGLLALQPAAAQDRPAAGAAKEGSPPAPGSETGAAKRPGAKSQTTGAAPAAAQELARVLVSSEDWSHALDQYSSGLAQQVTQSLSQRGEKPPDGLQASIRKELGQELPYQQVIEREAAALAKHFTPDELKRAIAFYTSPLGKKAIQAVPQSQAELGRDLQERLATAVPQIVQRLAPKAMEAPGAGQGGAAGGASSRAGGAGEGSRSSAAGSPSAPGAGASSGSAATGGGSSEGSGAARGGAPAGSSSTGTGSTSEPPQGGAGKKP